MPFFVAIVTSDVLLPIRCSRRFLLSEGNILLRRRVIVVLVVVVVVAVVLVQRKTAAVTRDLLLADTVAICQFRLSCLCNHCGKLVVPKCKLVVQIFH